VLFNSFTFALFFPLVAAATFAAPRSWRPHVLLAASLAFYSWWKVTYGAMLLLTTALDWWVVGRMAAAPPERRFRWLAVTLGSNLGLLFVFKYWNLFNSTAAALLPAWPLPNLTLTLPLGISFYTFLTMAYAVDVYRGTIPAVPSLARFALFVWYFPHMIAGPIMRAADLVPQFDLLPDFDVARVVSGVREAAWGMFKKVVVADRLAFLVNAVYADPSSFGGFGLTLAVAFFAFQVYYDFSGYSEIARGTSRILGVELMKNFDRPFRSRSMSEWWQHWHVSLSTWFRDYLYFPLGGSRAGPARWAFATAVVFLVSGLWHGASWTFLFWGALNGGVVVLDGVTRRYRDRFASAVGLVGTPRFVVQVVTTGIVWALLLVPFRSESFADMVYVYGHLTSGWSHLGDLGALGEFLNKVDLEPLPLLFGVALVPLVETVDALRQREDWVGWWRSLPAAARWSLDWAVLFGVLFFGCWVDSPFVYFQF
jgi:alginate O-acetyltransferase complex protein AlgI